jgi:hypothetical protein
MPILKLGDGADGSITISTNKNINSNLITNGRTYADGVYSKVNSIGASSVILPAGLNGLAVGDEVILINLMGRTGYIANAGNYEFLTVASIVSNTVNFSEIITKNYGDDGGNDNIINHPVMIQRIPNYIDVTINSGAILTANEPPRGANKPIELGGLVAFRCSGTLNIVNGWIDVNYKGYGGGGGTGEGYKDGYGIGRGTSWGEEGAGGGYGTAGVLAPNTSGGDTYGVADLSKIFPGSGGGSGTFGVWIQHGGDGGGIILVSANVVTITTGGMRAKGENGGGPDQQNGGGGSGGSILIHGGTISIPNGALNAEKGLKGGSPAGDGGDGRIAVYSALGALGGTAPAAYTDVLTMPFTIHGEVAGQALDFLRIYNPETGELLITYSGISIGPYSVNAPGEGPYDVIGRSATGEIIGWGDVTPMSNS